MVNKNVILSFISKYYLGGLNEKAKWRIKDNTLTVYAGDKGKVCKILLHDFNFEDAELGIYDTEKLSKLINITMGDLLFEPIKNHSIYSKLKISDENFDLTYSLADILVLGTVSYYRDPEEGYDVILNLETEDITNLIKGKNALLDQDNLLINVKDNFCIFNFGANDNYSNKVKYQIKGEIKDNELELPFNSDLFKEILVANKDSNISKIQISSLGIMKLNFTNDDIESEYFLARDE